MWGTLAGDTELPSVRGLHAAVATLPEGAYLVARKINTHPGTAHDPAERRDCGSSRSASHRRTHPSAIWLKRL